jgi:LysR family transcriptional regulator, nitrogen assimilation regulatory protein
MNIRRLRYFLRIADEGSMSRAATVLDVAQPALSRQMRLLEEALGVVLFRRTSRGIELTEEGEQLRASMVGPLRQLELALQNVGSPFAHIEGGLVLGMPATAAYLLAEPLLRRLATAFPKLKLRFVDHDSGRLIEDMLKGEVDLALIHGPTADERLFTSELLVEDLALVGGPSSALSPDRPVSFTRLADFPLVLPSFQPGLRGFVEKTALRLQVKIDVRFEVDALQVSKELIEAGLAYGLLPVSACGRELRSHHLRHAPICDPAIAQHVVFAVRPQLVMPRSFVAEVGSLVRSEVARLVEGGEWPGKLLFE